MGRVDGLASTRAVTERVRELLELALLLLLVSQFLLGRIRGCFHARRALRLEGFVALGLAAIREQCLAPVSNQPVS